VTVENVHFKAILYNHAFPRHLSRVIPAIKHRSFATEEAQTKTEQPELSENEKKLTGELEKVTKDVEVLTEKNKELDVSEIYGILMQY
jgi:hypothetical protein